MMDALAGEMGGVHEAAAGSDEAQEWNQLGIGQ